MTVSTLERSISVTTAPGTWLSGATLMASAASRRMSASLPGVSEPTLRSSLRSLAPCSVAKRMTSREVSNSGRSFLPSIAIWLTNARCSVMAERSWVKKSAVMVHSTSTPHLERLQDRRHAVAHGHLDRKGDRYAGAGVLDRLPARLGDAGHVNEQIVRAELPRGGELVERLAHPERAHDMRRDRQIELGPNLPRLLVDRPVDLPTHHHGDELIVGREMLRLDARRIAWIPGLLALPFEVAEDSASPRVHEPLDRGVRMLR